MAEPGAVSRQFERKGYVDVARAAEEDDVMMVGLDAGAEDMQDLEELWRVICEPSEVQSLRTALEEAGIEVLESDSTMQPSNTVPIDNKTDAGAVLRLVDLLDDHEDVQDVYSNVDISDDIGEELAAAE